MFRVPAFVFPSQLEALLSWRWLHICLPMGSSKLIPLHALLSCGTFPLLIKLSISIHPFSPITLSVRGGSE